MKRDRSEKFIWWFLSNARQTNFQLPVESCQNKIQIRQLSNISPWPTNRDRRKIEWKQMQILIVEIVSNKHWKYPVMATRQIERSPIKFYDHTCNNILSAIHTSACHVSNWPEHRLVINWSPHLPPESIEKKLCNGIWCLRRTFVWVADKKRVLCQISTQRIFATSREETTLWPRFERAQHTINLSTTILWLSTHEYILFFWSQSIKLFKWKLP